MRSVTILGGELQSIVGVLTRRQDLNELIAWAKRRRLTEVRRCYERRLEDEETRLNRYAVQRPNMTRWARMMFGLHRQLKPKPRYYRRGSAAKYRVKNLTRSTKDL